MQSLFSRARAFVGRAAGQVGNILKRVGDTSAQVVRTIGTHSPALKSFVNDVGSHFGGPGASVAGLVGKGIDALSSDTAGKIADRLSRWGQSLNTYK
jgi:hypothetical protein